MADEVELYVKQTAMGPWLRRWSRHEGARGEDDEPGHLHQPLCLHDIHLPQECWPVELPLFWRRDGREAEPSAPQSALSHTAAETSEEEKDKKAEPSVPRRCTAAKMGEERGGRRHSQRVPLDAAAHGPRQHPFFSPLVVLIWL
jgi:hypothetical protein